MGPGHRRRTGTVVMGPTAKCVLRVGIDDCRCCFMRLRHRPIYDELKPEGRLQFFSFLFLINTFSMDCLPVSRRIYGFAIKTVRIQPTYNS